MKVKYNYSAWQIDEKDFPYEEGINAQVEYLVKFGILAPSTFNSQPWRCKIINNKLVVYLDLEKLPKVSDKSGRFGYITIGCFIENILISAAHFNFASEVKFTENLGSSKKSEKYQEIATITFTSGKVDKSRSGLFPAITQRATNRSLSKSKNIEKSVLIKLREMAEKNQNLQILTSKNHKSLTEISSQADAQVWGDIEFRREHVGWVRNNITKQFDGMPGFGVGVKLIPSFFARPVILSKIFPKLQARKNIKAISSTRHFVALISDDSPEAWIKIGMLFERLALFLTLKGIVCSPMGHFIEDDTARNRLTSLLELKGQQKPQIFFRIGFPSEPVRHSPRRTVEQIIF